MKKTLFLLSMLLACTFASAQDILTQVGKANFDADDDYSYCPQEYSYNGNAHFFVRRDDYSDERIYDVYNDELQKEKTLTISNVASIRIDNLNSTIENDGVPLTQTLFNNDDKYEWITKTQNDSKYTGFKIMQEGDVELCSIDLGLEVNWIYFYLWYINDKVYFVASYEFVIDDQWYEYSNFYTIDPNDESGIKLVKKINGLSVTPTILDRSTPVTVDFADGSDVSHEITVTSSNGQVVARQNVAAGQSSVTLDTSHWGNGLNIVTTKNANNKTESCKIIIK